MDMFVKVSRWDVISELVCLEILTLGSTGFLIWAFCWPIRTAPYFAAFVVLTTLALSIGICRTTVRVFRNKDAEYLMSIH